MSDEKDMAQKESERLMKSLGRTQKSAAEKKLEEQERQKKYAERKKKEDEERVRHEEARKKDLAAKEEQRKKEQACERERTEEEAKRNAAYVPDANSEEATRKEEERFARAFKGNIPESSGGVDTTSLPTNFVSNNSEDEGLRKEEERMAKMFGQKSPRNLDTVPPALRSHVVVDPHPHVVKIVPQNEAQIPPALRLSPRGDNAASGVPQALRTVVVPATPPVKKDAELVGTYKLAAYGGESTVEIDCSASRKFWTVKVLPCKYNTDLTVQIAGGTVDFLAKYNGGVHPRSVDLPMLVKLRPDCISVVSQDPTGITFQINVVV